MGYKVEHLHDTLVWVDAIIAKVLFNQGLESFESCSSFQEIDGCTEDINGDVEFGASREETVRVVDEVTLYGTSSAKKL